MDQYVPLHVPALINTNASKMVNNQFKMMLSSVVIPYTEKHVSPIKSSKNSLYF